MRTIIFKLSLLLVFTTQLTFLSLSYAKTALAVEKCDVKALNSRSTTPDDTDKLISLRIDSNNAIKPIPEKGYWININGIKLYDGNVSFNFSTPNPDNNGVFYFPHIDSKSGTDSEPNDVFKAGTYTLRVTERDHDEHVLCEGAFTVLPSQAGSDNYCKVTLTNTEDHLTTNDYIGFQVEFLQGDSTTTDPNWEHRVWIQNEAGVRQFTDDTGTKYITADLKDGATTRYYLSSGTYSIEIRQNFNSIAGFSEGKTCVSRTFHIDTVNNGGGYYGCHTDTECRNNLACQGNVKNCLCLPDLITKKPTCRIPEKNEGRNPCAPAPDPNNPNVNPTPPFNCQTAIGTISTSPEGFLQRVLSLILGLSGGIVLLFLIINGYRLMTSQGDPEKVKEARESVIGAIGGLLFIIFSLVILQFITIDILHLPGFTGTP